MAKYPMKPVQGALLGLVFLGTTGAAVAGTMFLAWKVYPWAKEKLNK